MRTGKIILIYFKALIVSVFILFTSCSKGEIDNINEPNITIQKKLVEITWENPADIIFGTPLSATQLNATTDVDGTYSYIPSSGKVFDTVGSHWLRIDFTPKDTARYISESKTVYINVVLDNKVINNSVAGNLATVAASYLTSVGNLKITGTIDARDFKTMRDLMPMLEVIDLSGAEIVAYEGTEGTNGTSSTLYPANTIPNFAFSFGYNGGGKGSLKTFIFPQHIISIGTSSFFGCPNLTSSLTIPTSVATIEESAFLGCRGVNGSINIPASVSQIGYNAFLDFGGSIDVNEFNLNYSSQDGVLFNKDKTTLIQCPVSKTGHYNIPTTTSIINSESFRFCNRITTITIPLSVAYIGSNSFENCSGLTSLEIPSSVKEIGDNAFYYCFGLKSLTLDLPTSVIGLGYGIFSGCNGLTSISVPVIKPDNYISSYLFSKVNTNTCILHVPVGSKSLYEAAYLWKDFQNIVDDLILN